MDHPASKLNLGCVFLASGCSKRFQGNKLLADFGGRPLIDTVFRQFPGQEFQRVLVVTRYPQVEQLAQSHGFSVVHNPDETDDIAVTIRLGLEALGDGFDGCLFSVCDQPRLHPDSIRALTAAFRAHPHAITALSHQGQRGNPVLFPRELFPELRTLAPNQSGAAVIARHPERLRLVEAHFSGELDDVDRQSDLEALIDRG